MRPWIHRECGQMRQGCDQEGGDGADATEAKPSRRSCCCQSDEEDGMMVRSRSRRRRDGDNSERRRGRQCRGEGVEDIGRQSETTAAASR